MSRTFGFLVLLSALVCGACKKESSEQVQPEPKVQAKSEEGPAEQAKEPAADLSPEVPQFPDTPVVIPEDLEEEAARTVSLDNLEAELDRLEAEIMGG